MTCKRCEDIHQAQLDGKTQTPCKCDCHVSYTTGTTAWLFNTASTSDNINFTPQFTSGTATANCGNYTCTCITSSEQCDDCKNAPQPCYPTTHTMDCNTTKRFNYTKDECNCDYQKGGHDKGCKA